MKIFSFTAAILAFVCIATPALAERIVIGAWNIQDLHHENNFRLRKFDNFWSTGRQEVDYKLLQKYANLFGRDGKPADVIALQEMGTPEAIHRVFPKTDYDTFMSSRYPGSPPQEGEGDVYTAIAIRKASPVKVLERSDLSELAVLHNDGRPTRAGTALRLQVNGQQFWFMSLHLKSSCAGTKNVHTVTGPDCQTLWQQMPILQAWVKEKRDAGLPVILAGDFNRRFRKYDKDDVVWEALNGVAPEDSIEEEWFSRHPETATRKCPTRKGTSTEPIDWILLDAKVAHWFVEYSFWERRFTKADADIARGGLSDHCPISIDLKIE